MRAVIAIALCFPCACGCGVAKAQGDEGQREQPLSLPEALNLRSFGEVHPPAFSPDGNLIAFAIVSNARRSGFDAQAWSRTGVPWYGSGSDVYVLDVRSQAIRNLTEAKGNSWLPVWSPNGRLLAFLSDREKGRARLWLWDRTNDKLRSVSDVDVRTDEIEWSKDGTKLLLTTISEGIPANQFAQGASRGEDDQTGSHKSAVPSVTVYEADSKAGDGTTSESDPWNLNETLRDLAFVHLDDGTVDYLVRGQRIAKFSLSPDGRTVAYSSSNRFEKPGSQQILFDLSITNLASGNSRTLASNVHFDHDGSTFRWSPDSLRLSFQSGGPGEIQFNCYVIDVYRAIVRDVTRFRSPATAHRGSVAPLWSKDSETIYFLHDGALWSAAAVASDAREIARIPDRTITSLIPHAEGDLWTQHDGRSTIVLTHDDKGKEDGFYGISLDDGKSEKLLETQQCYTCLNQKTPFAVSENGKEFAFVAEDAQRAEDLWMTSEEFRAPLRITNLNPQFDRVLLGAPHLIDWMSDDGERQKGILLLPSSYRVGTRYPLIVWIYGGVRLSERLTQFGLGYSGPFDMQLLATRGYAVLLPDTPLPSGIHPFDLAKMVLPGVNKVIDMGVADADRLGIMGHSFGGYSTLSIISETTRFRAAVDSGGFGDLPAYYGEMDASGAAFGTGVLENGIASMGGTLWKFRERYVENSPVFYLDRVGTPLLIVHGATDTAVDPYLAEEIFVDLRRLGKRVEYARYEGEGHSPSYWGYSNQLDYCDRVISWFDKWLKK